MYFCTHIHTHAHIILSGKNTNDWLHQCSSRFRRFPKSRNQERERESFLNIKRLSDLVSIVYHIISAAQWHCKVCSCIKSNHLVYVPPQSKWTLSVKRFWHSSWLKHVATQQSLTELSRVGHFTGWWNLAASLRIPTPTLTSALRSATGEAETLPATGFVTNKKVNKLQLNLSFLTSCPIPCSLERK